MDNISKLIYINFLMFDGKVDKISNLLWPIIRDNDDAGVFKSQFMTFIDAHALDSSDLDRWPIVRFLQIWCP